MQPVLTTYAYNGLVVEVMPGVFQPNKTTDLLLEAALQHPLEGKSALDLGCGCGVVGMTAKKFGRVSHMYGSDVAAKAIENARHNAARLGLEVDYRQGNLFEPWDGQRFDVILNDVSGVAEEIAHLSPWYPSEIYCEAGVDGTHWTTQVLTSAKDHLNPSGVIFFPTVSLSNEGKILEVARSQFPRVECLLKKSWPFKEEFWQKIMSNETCRRLLDEGIVKVSRRGSRTIWETSVYMASLNP